MRRGPGPVRIAVCSSSYESNVAALISKMRQLTHEQPQGTVHVDFKELPYNEIENFRFHDKIDVMVLCHSKNNRGISITDVNGAIYGEYLPYCRKVFGK